jgi:Na+(H+)/acetate symporter ActP
MADRAPQRRSARSSSGWAIGFILFAGIMMLMAGFFQALAAHGDEVRGMVT